jgi:hypothetical protein
MARSRFQGKFQRVQRFTVQRLAAFAVIGALSASAYLSYTASGSGSLNHAATPPPTMHQWLEQSEPLIHDLVAARNDVATAAGHRDLVKTGAACQTATGAIAHLHQQLPSPDPVLNKTLQQAISSYAAGLPSCILGASAKDGEGLHRAATWISDGDAAMQAALDILDNASAAQPRNLGVLVV